MNEYKSYMSGLNLSAEFKNNLTDILLGNTAGARVISPRWSAPRHGRIKTKTLAIAAAVTACLVCAASVIIVWFATRDTIKLADNEFLIEGGGNSNVTNPYMGYCAYKLSKSVYDIDDVSVMFYFANRGDRVSTATLAISYDIDNRTDRVYNTVREIEDFSSDEYSGSLEGYNPICDGYETYKITFNHGEEIAVPADILREADGSFNLIVYGIDSNRLNDSQDYIESYAININGVNYNYFSYISIWYILDGNKVTFEHTSYLIIP